MNRDKDSIVSVELIKEHYINDKDAIIVVTWSDGTKSLWFKRKAPKYVLEMLEYCAWKGAIIKSEKLSVKTAF